MSKKFSQFIFVFLASLLLFAIIQFSTPNLVGFDGYYHIKMAFLMRTEGLKPDFPYMPFSILNPEDFVDHHFLFHLLLIPFTFGDLILGAKLASVLFPSISFTLLWLLLHNQRVAFAWIWSIALFALADPFLYRMSMPRRQSLAVGAIILGMNWLLQRKYKHYFVLAFFFVWLFDGFPVFLVLTLAYIIARWLIEGKFNWSPLVYGLSGLSLGFLLHPYFPKIVIFSYKHIIPKILSSDEISIGGEWSPFSTNQLLNNSTGLFLLLGATVGAFILFRLKLSLPSLFSLFMLLAFGFLLMQSRRFIEYIPPLAILFSALSFSNWVNASFEDMKTSGISKIREWLSGSMSELLKAILIVLLIAFAWRNIAASQGTIYRSSDSDKYAGAANWLIENTKEGERVFTTDWDDFPELFFHNLHNTYLVGLDPTYMHLFDNDLYFEWRSITRGDTPMPSEQIGKIFNARYVFSDQRHSGFRQEAAEDPNMIEVYSDSSTIIYEIGSP